MRSILNLVLDHQQNFFLFSLAGLIAILVTYLIYWISNRNAYIKYIPPILLIIISIYELYLGLPKITESYGLEKIMTFGVLFVAGFVSLMFAFILQLYRKPKDKKNKAKKEKKVKDKKEIKKENKDKKTKDEDDDKIDYFNDVYGG